MLVVPKQLPYRVEDSLTTITSSLRVGLTTITRYSTLPKEPRALGTVSSLPNGIE
jgi:hypothetical protein